MATGTVWTVNVVQGKLDLKILELVWCPWLVVKMYNSCKAPLQPVLVWKTTRYIFPKYWKRFKFVNRQILPFLGLQSAVSIQEQITCTCLINKHARLLDRWEYNDTRMVFRNTWKWFFSNLMGQLPYFCCGNNRSSLTI